MSGPRLVSIITAFYNRAAHVPESVGSLLAQTHRELEIIAVDDGSTDHTGDALRALASRDRRLRVVSHENRGFTRAIRGAAAMAQGDYVAVHDAGDVSHPERIAKLAAALDADPGAVIASSWVDDVNWHTGELQIHRPPTVRPLRAQLMRANVFLHGEVMFRRSVYERAGGYREFFTYAQDRDLWLRMSRWGDHVVVPEVLYRRVTPEGAVGISAPKIMLQRYNSDFAVQCARHVDEHGWDPLDCLGPSAVFLRRRSRALAHWFTWFGLRWMLHGHEEEGFVVVEQAWREARTAKTATVYALCALHLTRPKLWRWVVQPLLRYKASVPKVMANHGPEQTPLRPADR